MKLLGLIIAAVAARRRVDTLSRWLDLCTHIEPRCVVMRRLGDARRMLTDATRELLIAETKRRQGIDAIDAELSKLRANIMDLPPAERMRLAAVLLAQVSESAMALGDKP